MELHWVLIIAVATGVVAFFAGMLLRMFVTETKVGSAKRLAERIIEEAEKEAQTRKKEALVEAKDELFAERQKQEAETKEWRQELQGQERKISKREENLDARIEKKGEGKPAESPRDRRPPALRQPEGRRTRSTHGGTEDPARTRRRPLPRRS